MKMENIIFEVSIFLETVRRGLEVQDLRWHYIPPIRKWFVGTNNKIIYTMD